MESWKGSLGSYSSLCPQGIALCLPRQLWLKIFGVSRLGGEGEGGRSSLRTLPGPQVILLPFLLGGTRL